MEIDPFVKTRKEECDLNKNLGISFIDYGKLSALHNVRFDFGESAKETLCQIISLGLPEKSWFLQNLKYVRQLADNDRSAIVQYAHKASPFVNGVLRGQMVHEGVDWIIESMKSTIENALPLSRDIIVYRGFGNMEPNQEKIKEIWKELTSGRQVIDRGFVSASMLKNIAYKMSVKYGLIIHVPKGVKGIYIAPISGSSFEAEMIFGPGVAFKPLGCVEHFDEHDALEEAYFCHVEVVPLGTEKRGHDESNDEYEPQKKQKTKKSLISGWVPESKKSSVYTIDDENVWSRRNHRSEQTLNDRFRLEYL